MGKLLALTFLSISILLTSCGGGSQKGSNEVAGASKSSSSKSCFDEYSEMHDLGSEIGNPCGDFNNMVLRWNFDEETINEAISLLEGVKAACISALAYNNACSKLNESKVLLNEMANITKPEVEKALAALKEQRGNDKYFDALRQVRSALASNMAPKFITFLDTINESGANVVK